MQCGLGGAWVIRFVGVRDAVRLTPHNHLNLYRVFEVTGMTLEAVRKWNSDVNTLNTHLLLMYVT